MDGELFSSLNAQQRAAATQGGGPLLIIAGAGTGKTNTLAHRVAHLIGSGTDAGRVLLLTFTRRSAVEMARRVKSILSAGSRSALSTQPSALKWSGTFHSISNRLLRMHGQAIGLGESFTVMDRSDAEDLLNVVRSELAFDKADVRFPRKETCLAIYSRCVNAGQPGEEVLKSHFPWCATFAEQCKALFKAYVARKQAQNILDYDDLLSTGFICLMMRRWPRRCVSASTPC